MHLWTGEMDRETKNGYNRPMNNPLFHKQQKVTNANH